MNKKVVLTDKSIEKIGLPLDYREAISQYIWNGYEAGATKIDIIFKEENNLGYISTFSIKDNGIGIEFDNLNETFGVLLDSKKMRDKKYSYIHGGKGKGRLSSQIFAGRTVWETIFKKNNKFYFHKIIINKDSRNSYTPDEAPRECNNCETGTTVIFENLMKITADDLISDSFISFLKNEFGWFLYLNRGRNMELSINGKPVNYKTTITDSKEFFITITEENGSKIDFKIDYILWDNKIGEDSYYHFLNSNLCEVYRQHTSFNKVGGRANGFIHSVFVSSTYFNNFECSVQGDNQDNLLGIKTQSDDIFKTLIKKLNKILSKELKNFYRLGAELKFKEFEKRKVLPNYKNNKYDLARKKDLKSVFREIYFIEPALFINLKPQQEKSFLGMLDLLLDSNERENIMKIIESIVEDLDKEGRERLANVLKKTNLSNIVRTIKLIEDREGAILLLKSLVYDLNKFTNERDHVQEAVQENTWLFGEEFNCLTCDKNFEMALSEYVWYLDGIKSVDDKTIKKYSINHPERLRRMDIFLCKQRLVDSPEYGDTTQLEENLIVELKSPKIILGKEQLRQVEDYRDFIIQEKRFHSEMKIWKFFLVGNNVDEYIKEQYKTVRDKGKKYLVRWQDNFEIYCMTWADMFDSYKVKHNFLLQKLNFDRNILQDELNVKGIDLSIKSSNRITEELITIANKK